MISIETLWICNSDDSNRILIELLIEAFEDGTIKDMIVLTDFDREEYSSFMDDVNSVLWERGLRYSDYYYRNNVKL
jgi:hypothetical protein